MIEWYAFEAGNNCQPEARDSFRRLAGSGLQDLIYKEVGYTPNADHSPFAKWHERLALNHKSAPKGYYAVFNESETVIYELISAGVNVGEKFVPDISIGKCWAIYWAYHNLGAQFGERCVYPHKYPEDHPQAKSNPQEAWCYPLPSLGDFRAWLQQEYLEGGKLKSYLTQKVKKGDFSPLAAKAALMVLAPP